MTAVAVWFLLLVASLAVVAIGLAHWGSDEPWVLWTLLGGFFSTALVASFAIVFALFKAGWWVWQHVRVEVTF